MHLVHGIRLRSLLVQYSFSVTPACSGLDVIFDAARNANDVEHCSSDIADAAHHRSSIVSLVFGLALQRVVTHTCTRTRGSLKAAVHPVTVQEDPRTEPGRKPLPLHLSESGAP
jgi:hypothetical protein